MILQELINYETHSLDLSFNTFTFRIMDSFQSVLSQEYSLKDLNLEGNKLGDAAIDKISKYALHLEVLNIANNSITNQGAIYIQRMLKNQTRLRELKLHWNRINGIGGKLIADALCYNDYLKVLDISYNSMGIGDQECAVYWAKMLSKDSKSGIIHLDISYNRFDPQSCKVIQSELKTNNTVYGIHFKGNCGEMDCLGHLVNIETNNQEKSEEQQQQPTFRRIKTAKEQKGQFGLMENCWICEGWQEKEFQWNPVFSGPVNLPPVFIHFNFDGYKPHQMKFINFNGRKYFSLFQMVPPNKKILYFFTASGNQLHAKDQQWTIKEQTIKIQFADQEKNCLMNKLNIINSTESNSLYDSDYNMTIGVVPRRQELDAFLPKQQELNFQWNLENSMFEEQIKNTPKDTFYDQCFEFDWRWGVRLNRAVREIEQLDRAKGLFKQNYEKLITLYKYYASYSPNGEIWCWNQQTFQEFVVEAGIFDARYFKIKDSLLCFIQSNNLAETKTHPQQFSELQLSLNPENCLVRYQLMEILTLIGIEKYVKTGLCQTLFDAVETIFKSDGFIKLIDSIPCNLEWRESKLYTEKCDNILRLYHQLFQQLFNKYSKRRDPKEFMGLFDFRLFLQDYKFTEIDERTANIIFNMSLPLQIDELNKQSHMHMDLNMFIESLARTADYLSFIPFKQEGDSYWTKEKCQDNPLHIKLESFILRLIKNSNNINFQKEFDYQDSSLFLEDFESIKHGKEILEKTRKMIQKKVVGNISILLMMKGKKEKEKTHNLTIQAPLPYSSHSLQNSQQTSQSLNKQEQNNESQVNGQQKQKKNYSPDKLMPNDGSFDNTNSQVISNIEDERSQIDISKQYIKDQHQSQTKEDSSFSFIESPQKRRSLIKIQTANLQKGLSRQSSKGDSPNLQVNIRHSLQNINNNDFQKKTIYSTHDSADIKSYLQSPLIGSNQTLENTEINEGYIKDFDGGINSFASTAMNSNKKNVFSMPKIKVLHNQTSRNHKEPSTATSSQISQPNLVHFFPKKKSYDIKELKKNVMSQNSLNMVSPRSSISSSSNLKSPTKQNQMSNIFSQQQQKKPK